MNNCFWTALAQIITDLVHHFEMHAEGYGVGIGAVVLSTAKNWPEMIPKSAQDWWTWMRNSVQTALPISRAPSGASTPTPPVTTPAPNPK